MRDKLVRTYGKLKNYRKELTDIKQSYQSVTNIFTNQNQINGINVSQKQQLDKKMDKKAQE